MRKELELQVLKFLLQVKVKSNPESLEEINNRLRYDFFYIENMSFKLDLEIMVRTVFVMLRGHGRA